MRKLITATLLAVLLGVSGLSLSACDQDSDGGGAAPDVPDQTAPTTVPNKPDEGAPSATPDKPKQNAPADGAASGGGTGPQNGDSDS